MYSLNMHTYIYIRIINREQVNQNLRELMTNPGLVTSYRCFMYKSHLTGLLIESNRVHNNFYSWPEGSLYLSPYLKKDLSAAVSM